MTFYLVIKALHILSFTMWMTGMFYLPRLYAIHAAARLGGEKELLLQMFERRMLRYIINPAMILTFVFGLTMIVSNMEWLRQGWLHAKLLLVFLASGYHGMLATARKRFVAGDNTCSQLGWRRVSWIPLVFLTIIVFLAVVKPF